MDIAFSTVLMFLIISPGLIARFCYFTHPFANDARSTQFINEIFWSIIPGIMIQVCCAKIYPPWFDYNINFSDLGFLIIGSENNERLDRLMNNMSIKVQPIIFYNLSVWSTAAMLGFLLKMLVRWFKLDRRTEFFRFSNKWYYIMSGEILDTDSGDASSEDITIIMLDLLCNVGNENILYKGELVNYYLTKDGDLDSVLLRYPMRRKLNDPSGEAYQIPSNFLYIPEKEILNLNVRYLDLNFAQNSIYLDFENISDPETGTP